MGSLTTYVVDTTTGKPATNIAISLYKVSDFGLEPLLNTTTNESGKTEHPLLEGEALTSGQYQLVFNAANHFYEQNKSVDPIPFFNEIVIRFGISDSNHQHHITSLFAFLL